MKSSLLAITLIGTLFLASCSVDWNDEKEKKIVELEKKLNNDIFKKKNECWKLINGTTPDNIIKHEIIYWGDDMSCFVIGTLSGGESRIVDLFSRKIIFELTISNKKVQKLSWIDKLSLSWITVEEWKCLFNKKVRDLKWNNYPSDADYFLIDCNK